MDKLWQVFPREASMVSDNWQGSKTLAFFIGFNVTNVDYLDETRPCNHREVINMPAKSQISRLYFWPPFLFLHWDSNHPL